MTFSFLCFQLPQHSLGITVCCTARWNGASQVLKWIYPSVNTNFIKGKKWEIAELFLLTCKISKSILTQPTETSLCVHIIFTLTGKTDVTISKKLPDLIYTDLILKVNLPCNKIFSKVIYLPKTISYFYYQKSNFSIHYILTLF